MNTNDYLTISGAIAVIWGIISPYVIKLIVDAHWSGPLKFAVSAAFSLVGGSVAAYLAGRIVNAPTDWTMLIIDAGIILPIARSVYEGLKSTGTLQPRNSSPTLPDVGVHDAITPTAADVASITKEKS